MVSLFVIQGRDQGRRFELNKPVMAIGRGVPALKHRTERVNSLVVAPIVCKALGIDAPGLSEKVPAVFEAR